MKDREIGEVFEEPGIGMLQVVEEGAVNECYGCVFNNPEHCGNPQKFHSGECSMDMRYDKKGVIFRHVKKEDEND